MPHQILYMGNFNVAGICHAISCKWIKQSRLLGNVNTLQELESPMAMFTNWQLADDWRGINENYHLPAVEVLIRPHLDGQWLAEQSTRINGYTLIILWGGGISVQERAHIR